MGISIKGLNVKKDKITATHYSKYGKVHTTTKLEGKLNLELEHNGFIGSGEIEIAAISENLHNKLYDVLVEIENELNGVTNKTDTGGFTVTSHNGETVLTSDEVGNMYVKGNVEFSDAKLKQPEEAKSHNTDKDENEQLADMLFKASKVLGTTVISGDTTVVDAKNITDAIRKMMESKDFKLL